MVNKVLGGGIIDGQLGINPDWLNISAELNRQLWSIDEQGRLVGWIVKTAQAPNGNLLANGLYANPAGVTSDANVDNEQIESNSKAIKALLVAQGLSGNYGFFADGFAYGEVGDVGIDVDGKIYTYAGTDTLPVNVAPETDPVGDADYEQVFLNDSSNIKFKQSGTALSVSRVLSNKLEERAISIRDFGAVCNGIVDDTQAILNAISVAGITGIKCVDLTYGKIRYTSEIVVPRDFVVFGRGYSTFPDTANTILLKDGSFTGVKVLDAAQLKDVSVEGAAGNGGDGVALLGGRALLQNVSSYRHGQDGFKIGAYSGTPNNTNLWRAYNLISESNGRHGLYASDDNGDYNCNAGCLYGYDSSLNGEDGIRANLAADTQWYGVTCQVNGGYGFYADQARGNYLRAYLEQNSSGEAYYSAVSSQNKHEGSRSSIVNGGITNLNPTNSIMDSSEDIGDYWVTNVNFYGGIKIGGGGSSGQWNIRKDANRNLLIDLDGTTATGYWHFGADGREQGIRISDGSILRKMRNQGTTLNFGSVPANSTSDQTMSITGITSEYGLTLTATFALPAGVIVSAYFNGTNVIARCANITGSPISVSGAFRLTALKIGA